MRIASVEAVPLAVSYRETFRFRTTDRTTSPNDVVAVEDRCGSRPRTSR